MDNVLRETCRVSNGEGRRGKESKGYLLEIDFGKRIRLTIHFSPSSLERFNRSDRSLKQNVRSYAAIRMARTYPMSICALSKKSSLNSQDVDEKGPVDVPYTRVDLGESRGFCGCKEGRRGARVDDVPEGVELLVCYVPFTCEDLRGEFNP